MNYKNIYAFSLATPDVGYRNQILGAINAISELTGNEQTPETAFVLPLDINHYTEIRQSISFAQYKNYAAFKSALFPMLDSYFSQNHIVPRVFVAAYNLTEKGNTEENTDMLCRVIKEYYAQNNLGQVLTTVLSSKVHEYKYVDLINVPKHIMTFNSRIRLLQNKKLRKKVLITIGTINNFSRKNINEKFKILLRQIDALEKDVDLKSEIAKLKQYIQTPKKVVLCLGGRVEGPEIIFEINYAQKLFSDAERLVKNNYGVIFVNGPRTPSNVSDFLFEQAQNHPSILFFNSKRIATEEEKTPQNWRLYFGRYEKEFKKQQKLGNIYPGILGFDNTLVMHTLDSYACCETANAAIPTAISSRGLYISPKVRYDCYNLYKLLCPKFAIDWDEFVDLASHTNAEPQDISPQVLSSPLRAFVENIVNKVVEMQKKKI